MNLAIWTVTRGAALLGKEYKERIEKSLQEMSLDLYALQKFEIEGSISMENFTEVLGEKFSSYDGHIFIMASGIVIRKLAPLLERKDKDPAVLLMDEGKHFVISLLSGHLGGANQLTNSLAEILHVIPVITTSSDITGKIAVDSISQVLKAELEDLNSAKDVTSLIVDGKKVNVLLPKNVNIKRLQQESTSTNADGIILVSNRKKVEITKICHKNIILGIGCKKNTKKQDILEAIEKAMIRHNLNEKAIKHIATVDVKAEEAGLIEAANSLGLDLKIISREEIKTVEHLFEGSDFVEENIGVRAVSEPVALLSSHQNGSFLEMKGRYGGITISIYEEEL